MALFFNNFTAPFLSSPIIQSLAPASLTDASPHISTPQAWLCCHCIHDASATNSQNLLAATSCSQCEHERCGLCDTIVDDQNASVSGEELLFHLDEGQKQVKEMAGLRYGKKGDEWMLGQTSIGPGSVLVVAVGVMGAVAMVS